MTVMATEKLPYDAKHVIYRESAGGKIVHAFWTGDPAAAALLADPNTAEDVINRLWFRDDVEIVATATRHYRYEGAGFSGWVVESGGYPIDSISNKREAMRNLRAVVVAYFKR